MASILRSRVSGVSNDEKGNVINKERKLIKENYYLDNQNYNVIVNCEIPAIDILDSDDIKIWSTVAPFIQVANYSVLQPPILNGNYQLHEQVIQNTLTQSQTIDCDNIIVNPLANSIYISIPGTITAEYDNVYRLYNYTFQLSTIPDSNILSFNITILENEYSNPGDATCFNRVFLNYAMNPDEKELEEDEEIGFYGFGESFTYLNLRGRVVPILVSEQGVGRGVEPLTDYFNVNVSEGAGGDWYTTYAPKAAYFTDTNKGFIVDQSSIIIFDLTSANTVTVEAWSSSLYGHILSGKSWFDLITLMTNITGRPPAPLPRWSQLGAVVGLEGGTENVTKIVNKLLARGVPLAGVWLQDWVGMRHSWDGDRLIWNWEVNYDWYPGWNDMVAEWASLGTRVLTYISPFFSDPTNFTASASLRHNFYQEGINNDYFVQKETTDYTTSSPSSSPTSSPTSSSSLLFSESLYSNSSEFNTELVPYTLHSLSIEFCMLDTTNPAAVTWIKNIIKDQLIAEAQSSGWMCDFGEYLPFDAVLNNSVSASDYHNKYPEEWARIMREAIVEAGREDDVLFFMRSAWLRSPKYNTLFWLGDQLVSWDGYDGLQSAITGAVSSGLTGSALIHSDIGGYNSVFTLGAEEGMYFTRSAELLKRWTEFAAFGSALFRTHIGSSTSKLNAQIYDTDESIDHFAKFSNIFQNLSAYRELLMTNASLYGYPLIRPLAMHYPDDEEVWRQLSRWEPHTSTSREQIQYMFGADFLITPCVTPNATYVSTYLPRRSGMWAHLWSGDIYEGDGQTVVAYADVGFPFVLYQANSTHGMQLREFVIMKNYTSGYHPSSNSTNGGITASTDDGNLQLSSVVLVLGTVLPLLIIVFLVYVWSGSVPEKLTCGRRTSQNVQSTEDKIPLIHADDDCNSR